MIKILFMGTSDFSCESLKKIYEKGYEVVGVVTGNDKPQGRKMVPTPTPVKVYALSKGLNVLEPNKLKDEEFIKTIRNLNPDLICVVSYGKILPKEILELPRTAEQ